jgi:hypothetical protein
MKSPMIWLRVALGGVAAWSMLSFGATPFILRAQSPHAVPVSDSAIVSAVVEGLISDGRVPLRLSPAPLNTDVSTVNDAESDLALVSADVVRSRLAALQAKHVEPLSGTTTQGCWGVRVPLAPGQHRNACPEHMQFTAAVSLARDGGPSFPGGRTIAYVPQAGDKTVRVILTKLSRMGSSTEIYDMVVRARDGTWVVVQRELLMFAE